jgi:DNA-binding transcriptional LysR family regulator
LNTIAAFEAAARLTSFTKAAEELNLSQGAVSRQIQVLEERIGVALFNRRHKEIHLTKAGFIFQQAITRSLLSIRRAVSVIENLETQTVTIAASVGMSSFWLMPAIIAFREEHPQIDIRVLASDQQVDPRKEPVDLAIRYGDGHWQGLEKVKLFDEEIFPVCSRDYLIGKNITSLHDLSRENLIELDTSITISQYSSWENWFESACEDHGPLHYALTLSNYDLVYRALCKGNGIALAWSYGIPLESRDDLLVRPLDVRVSTGLSEYLVYSDVEAPSESTKVVLAWLLKYAQDSIWN